MRSIRKFIFLRNIKEKKDNRNIVREQSAARLLYGAGHTQEEICSFLESSVNGMEIGKVENSRRKYGRNVVSREKENSLAYRMFQAFINPFTAILLVLAGVSAYTDIILAQQGEKNGVTVGIIAAMVLISGLLRFAQETKSGNAAEKLSEMIRSTATVTRIGEDGRCFTEEIPMEELVTGDVVQVSAGDMLPADIILLTAKDLFISQSALTGESEPVEKQAGADRTERALTEYANLAFMGSNVISGSGRGIVAATGDATLLGGMAGALAEQSGKTSFEKGVNSVSLILIRFMLCMVPVVLFLNGFTKGNWMNAALFAISIAVGLTPEMLPMIVTTCLAKGAVAMSSKKVIIRNLNAIQNMGAMDILCTDKTGTLTQDKVVLEYHRNLAGQEDERILRHAFLNSYYQTGLKNLMDIAIMEKAGELAGENGSPEELEKKYTKTDEIPFDFERRRMSVVVTDKKGKTQMITKGAVEEMLEISAFVDYRGKILPLTAQRKAGILRQAAEYNAKGLRVIAVAQKTNPAPAGAFSVQDEADMVLMGYLAFLDPPKETTAAALKALRDCGVGVRILTGDNERVTCSVCAQVGMDTAHILTGTDLEAMTDEQLAGEAEKTAVFAKLSPEQKARVVKVLRGNGHVVGYMGDGINDAAAMKVSDAGISVDTAVDIARESADVVLLNKDLLVLGDGIREGRKIYGNMIKYIKMTASSNFGNMFSVLAASAFLPFLPMASIQLILLNLIYDISCTAIPWDNVDEEFLKRPRAWDASDLGRFMLIIGPVSSVFDILTFLLMYFVICPAVSGGLYYHQITDPAARMLFTAVFQAGWFVESMWSQTLVIHMIRTQKIPFLQSRASLPVTLLTFAGIAGLTAIPFTPFGKAIGLAALPAVYFVLLGAIVICYMLLATAAKKFYVRRYGELL